MGHIQKLGRLKQMVVHPVRIDHTHHHVRSFCELLVYRYGVNQTSFQEIALLDLVCNCIVVVLVDGKQEHQLPI